MKFIRSLYLRSRLFLFIGGVVLLFLIAFFFPILLGAAKVAALVIVFLVVADVVSLYRMKAISATRTCADRFSNGDDNKVELLVTNYYPFSVKVSVIDELPFQFQVRNFLFDVTIKSGEKETLIYYLRPVKRGEYVFGALHVYAQGVLGLVAKRYSFEAGKAIEVYPSIIQMKKYELQAVANRQAEAGIRKIRKVGHNMEFDQIREYIVGDDVRNLNWKATARKGILMVNQYQEEKSQNIYFAIDKGRTMKMPFEGMTILDYAINSTLALSNIALKKYDKAGLITYNKKISAYIPASHNTGNEQLSKIIRALYKEKTAFLETNNEVLFSMIKNKINHRSLIFLFTNFETVSAFRRQLPLLKKIANNHLLVIIFFENTELKVLLEKEVETVEEIYIKTVAEKLSFEKKLIQKELQHHGILSILTTPQKLSINLINKYLEIKGRNLL